MVVVLIVGLSISIYNRVGLKPFRGIVMIMSSLDEGSHLLPKVWAPRKLTLGIRKVFSKPH